MSITDALLMFGLPVALLVLVLVIGLVATRRFRPR